MTIEKANELLAIQAQMRGDYNRYGAMLKATDQLVTTLKPEQIFGFKTGT